MASTHNAGDTQALKQVWTSEWGLDPVEETKLADWVAEPNGVQKFGNKLNLRKLPSIGATTYTSNITNGLRANLTGHVAEATTVTVDPTGKYFVVGVDRALANRCVDDGNLRDGYKKQGMAGLWTAMDVIGFALGASASSTVTQADFDDAMVRTALGQLATNAGNKFTEDSAKLLVVHPSELKNVWNIPAVKEYQIRGSIGAAVNAKLNAYGLVWRESGSVYNNGTNYFNPLLLKDGWALAWNEKPHLLEVQPDGLVDFYIGYAEVGWAEWFDSSVVACLTT